VNFIRFGKISQGKDHYKLITSETHGLKKAHQISFSTGNLTICSENQNFAHFGRKRPGEISLFLFI